MATFKDYFGNPSGTVTGGVVSSFQGGAIAGTMVNMVFADKIGRKYSILVGAIISCLGCAIQAGAVAMSMLIVGRFIAGVAVGMLTATIPMYASELSEPQWRASLSGLLQWMLSWGYLVAQWLGYGCSFNTTEFSCKADPMFFNLFYFLGRILSKQLLRALPFGISMHPGYNPGGGHLVPQRVS